MDTSIDRLSRGLASTTSRRQALKLFGGGLVGGALASAGLVAARDAVAKPAGRASLLTDIPVTGTVEGTGALFQGTLTLTQLYLDDAGNLSADGAVSTAGGPDNFYQTPISLSGVATTGGSLAQANGSAVGRGRTVLAQQGGSCQVLFLTIEPIHLELLGLVVDLDAVTLDIHAERGPGNLLGNLLCSLTGLLDNANLGGAQNVVNQINGLLG